MPVFEKNIRQRFLTMIYRVLVRTEQIVVRLGALDPTDPDEPDDPPVFLGAGGPPAHWIERVRRHAPELLHPGTVYRSPWVDPRQNSHRTSFSPDRALWSPANAQPEVDSGDMEKTVLPKHDFLRRTRNTDLVDPHGLQFRKKGPDGQPLLVIRRNRSRVAAPKKNGAKTRSAVDEQDKTVQRKKQERQEKMAPIPSPLSSTGIHRERASSNPMQRTTDVASEKTFDIADQRHRRPLSTADFQKFLTARKRPVPLTQKILPTPAVEPDGKRMTNVSGFSFSLLSSAKDADPLNKTGIPRTETLSFPAHEPSSSGSSPVAMPWVQTDVSVTDVSRNPWPVLAHEKAVGSEEIWPDLPTATAFDGRNQTVQRNIEDLHQRDHLQHLFLEQQGFPWNV